MSSLCVGSVGCASPYNRGSTHLHPDGQPNVGVRDQRTFFKRRAIYTILRSAYSSPSVSRSLGSSATRLAYACFPKLQSPYHAGKINIGATGRQRIFYVYSICSPPAELAVPAVPRGIVHGRGRGCHEGYLSERTLHSGIASVGLLKRDGVSAAFHFYPYMGMYEVCCWQRVFLSREETLDIRRFGLGEPFTFTAENHTWFRYTRSVSAN